jgi:peptide/nickel transport system permease protein
MSAPDATPELLAAVTPAEKRPAQWIVTIREAWRMGRTKAGVIIFVAIVALALLGPLFAPDSPTSFVGAPFASPSAKAWLGTDYIGHDVLSRVLWGGRTVIGLALAATVIGLLLGVGLGMISGYARRWVDETVMRILDIVLAFPSIVLALLFVSIVGPKLWLIVLMVGISHAPRIARVTRAATVEIAQRDFIKSAEALGVARRKILAFEILPNITSPLLVEFGLRLTYSIGLIAGLSFLGFGLQQPAADWGLMINENRIGITVQPWPVAVPVILIGILTIGTNLVADGLGRALIGIERDTGGT